MQNLGKLLSARSHLKNSLRNFFETHHFIEVDTPILVPCPGTELHLNYFKTQWKDHYSKDHTLWMRSSPELALKRAISAGIPALYQIAPSFRNHGELGPWHHPEFTMLEYYQVGASWESFLKLSEKLIRFCIKEMALKFPVALSEKTPLHYISVHEAFKRFADIDLQDEDPYLANQAKKKGVLSINGSEDFETAFFKILIEKIEPSLTKLNWVVLYDYPPSQAALARVENGFAKRFEFYIQGIELSNGFYELCDLEENRKRIVEVHKKREQEGREVPNEDFEFYAALKKGMPECFGNALGFDRLLALILGVKDLGEVIPFASISSKTGAVKDL